MLVRSDKDYRCSVAEDIKTFNTLQLLVEEPLNYFSRRGSLILNADYSLQRRRAVFG